MCIYVYEYYMNIILMLFPINVIIQSTLNKHNLGPAGY